MKTRRQTIAEDRLTNESRKRAETSENGRENSFPIPSELIVDIFSRLPLKSVAKCRCVSKPFASILRRPDFTELFLSRSCARRQLLFACQNKGELFFFSAPQPQNPDENSSPLVVNSHMKLSFDGRFGFSGLVHGLVGVTNKRISKGKKETVPVICNPSTGQSLSSPKVKTRRVEARCLFGYDPIDKQFKVLSMTRAGSERENFVSEKHQVMTLGTGNHPSWRMIEWCIPSFYYYPHIGICVNGVLYYLSICTSTETYMLSCFEVRSEKFSFIIVKEDFHHHGTMVNYNDKLGILRVGEGGHLLNAGTTSIELLVLEDLERQEWSEHTYVLPPLWKNLVGKTARLSFVGVIGTNEIVMNSSSFESFCPGPLYLFYFNIERDTVIRVEIQGIDLTKYGPALIYLDHVEDVKII